MMRRLFRHVRRSASDIRSELDEELRFHIDARTEELIAGGSAPKEARTQAEREFGDIEDAREYIARIDRATEHARRRRWFMEEFTQDIVYAMRRLRGSKLFAITAIVTLALGIGANTAIFSMVRGVLLRPLPFPEPEELYRVWSANTNTGNPHVAVSSPDVEDWRAQRQNIADIGGYRFADGASGLDLTGSGEPERLSIVFVTTGFFETLGMAPQLGRLPRDDELVRGGADHVVVLTHGFWQRRFGGSPDVVGTALTLNGEPYEVLGVMPPELRYPTDRADAFVPYSSVPDESIPHIRPVRILAAIARAGDGMTEEAVLAELNTIAGRLAQQYPENESYTRVTIEPLQRSITGSVRTGLLVLLGAVAFVLVLTCVNIASLMLARATTRGREIATRVALGAGRARIVRQLLTESVVLSLIGGAAGVGLAYLIVNGLLGLSSDWLPRGAEVKLDAVVLLFATALSVTTGLLFGMVPALRSTSANLQSTLREGGRGLAGTEGRRLRNGLVVVEVALALMLVAAAGLMTRSFITLLRVDPGFQPERLLATVFTINTARHPNPQHALLYTRLLENVRAIPGVVSAGAVKDAPFRGEGERWGFRTPQMVLAVGQDEPSAMIMHVSDGYFRTIGARIVEGREFNATDRRDAPFVIVVNEALARQYFPGQSVAGESLVIDGENVPIIGVVGDIRQTAMEEPGQPTIYINNVQNTRVKVTMVTRAQGDPLTIAGPVQEAIRALDPDQTITSIFTYDEIVREAVSQPRLLTVLLLSFGVLGLILGALGIYGVLAFTVSQRQREIGMRIALGAHPHAVQRMFVTRGLGLAAVGIAIGLVAALALGRFLSGVLFGIEPSDPLTFAAVTLVLVAVAFLASWLPSRRAASVDPLVALRSD